MAKKGNSSNMGFAKQRANIMASKAAYKQDRLAGFRVTNDIVGNIFGNLKTTMRGVGSELTSSNARQLTALQRLASRSGKSNARVIDNARGTAAGLYGIAGVAGAKPALDAAAAVAKGSKVALGGQVKAGKTLANSQATVLGIMGAGVAEAQAGAKAQTADALAYRAKEDAKLIASQQLELQKMKLQAQLDIDTYKKKLALDEKAAGGGSDGLTAVASFGVQAFAPLQELFNKPGNEDKSAAEIAQEYIKTLGGENLDPNAIALINSLASQMALAGAGPGNKGSIKPGETASFLTSQLTDTLDILYPNYSKHSKEVEKLLKAQLSVYAADAASSRISPTDQNPTYEKAGEPLTDEEKENTSWWERILDNITGGTTPHYGTGS